MALGNMSQLNVALNRGLDAGLTVSDVKEILVQLYACRLPTPPERTRRTNEGAGRAQATRYQRSRGREPSAIPSGSDILTLGTANQTKLLGGPVRGPLFEFAPAIDDFLKRHLFGDIFARDNLDWQSPELAKVSVLAAMPGVESQLLSHIGVSMNVGVTASQPRHVAAVLAEAGQADAAKRTQAALERHLAGAAK